MIPNVDRIPTPGKENRMKITQDDGAVVEGVLAYADDATQEGSYINKEKLDQFLAADGETAGTSTAFTLAQSNYQAVNGVHVRVKFHTVPGKRPTLNINSTGAFFVRTPDGLYLWDESIVAGTILDMIFEDNAYWLIGTGFNSVGPPIPAGHQVFERSGTFNPSEYDLEPGMTITVNLVGGGGGGTGGSGSNAGGFGGNSGEQTISNVVLPSSEPIQVTIGAGGAGGYYNGSQSTGLNRGNKGGTTSFGTFATAAGGDGGAGTWNAGNEEQNTGGKNLGGSSGWSGSGSDRGGGGGAGGAYIKNNTLLYPSGNGGRGGRGKDTNPGKGYGLSGGGGTSYYSQTIAIGGTKDGYTGGSGGGRNASAESGSPFGGEPGGDFPGSNSGGGGGGAGYGAGGGGTSKGVYDRGGAGYKGVALISWEAQ